VHISPALGRIKLKALAPAHVQGFYRAKLDEGLASSTVHTIHSVLHTALKRAVKLELVPRNTAAAVDPPRPRPKRYGPSMLLKPKPFSRLHTVTAWKLYMYWLSRQG